MESVEHTKMEKHFPPWKDQPCPPNGVLSKGLPAKTVTEASDSKTKTSASASAIDSGVQSQQRDTEMSPKSEEKSRNANVDVNKNGKESIKAEEKSGTSQKSGTSPDSSNGSAEIPKVVKPTETPKNGPTESVKSKATGEKAVEASSEEKATTEGVRQEASLLEDGSKEKAGSPTTPWSSQPEVISPFVNIPAVDEVPFVDLKNSAEQVDAAAKEEVDPLQVKSAEVESSVTKACSVKLYDIGKNSSADDKKDSPPPTPKVSKDVKDSKDSSKSSSGSGSSAVKSNGGEKRPSSAEKYPKQKPSSKKHGNIEDAMGKLFTPSTVSKVTISPVKSKVTSKPVTSSVTSSTGGGSVTITKLSTGSTVNIDSNDLKNILGNGGSQKGDKKSEGKFRGHSYSVEYSQKKHIKKSKLRDKPDSPPPDSDSAIQCSKCKEVYSTKEARRLHTCNSILDQHFLIDGGERVKVSPCSEKSDTSFSSSRSSSRSSSPLSTSSSSQGTKKSKMAKTKKEETKLSKEEGKAIVPKLKLLTSSKYVEAPSESDDSSREKWSVAKTDAKVSDKLENRKRKSEGEKGFSGKIRIKLGGQDVKPVGNPGTRGKEDCDPGDDGYSFAFAGRPTYSPSRIEPSAGIQEKESPRDASNKDSPASQADSGVFSIASSSSPSKGDGASGTSPDSPNRDRIVYNDQAFQRDSQWKPAPVSDSTKHQYTSASSLPKPRSDLLSPQLYSEKSFAASMPSSPMQHQKPEVMHFQQHHMKLAATRQFTFTPHDFFGFNGEPPIKRKRGRPRKNPPRDPSIPKRQYNRKKKNVMAMEPEENRGDNGIYNFDDEEASEDSMNISALRPKRQSAMQKKKYSFGSSSDEEGSKRYPQMLHHSMSMPNMYGHHHQQQMMQVHQQSMHHHVNGANPGMAMPNPGMAAGVKFDQENRPGQQESGAAPQAAGDIKYSSEILEKATGGIGIKIKIKKPASKRKGENANRTPKPKQSAPAKQPAHLQPQSHVPSFDKPPTSVQSHLSPNPFALQQQQQQGNGGVQQQLPHPEQQDQVLKQSPHHQQLQQPQQQQPQQQQQPPSMMPHHPSPHQQHQMMQQQHSQSPSPHQTPNRSPYSPMMNSNGFNPMNQMAYVNKQLPQNGMNNFGQPAGYNPGNLTPGRQQYNMGPQQPMPQQQPYMPLDQQQQQQQQPQNFYQQHNFNQMNYNMQGRYMGGYGYNNPYMQQQQQYQQQQQELFQNQMYKRNGEQFGMGMMGDGSQPVPPNFKPRGPAPPVGPPKFSPTNNMHKPMPGVGMPRISPSMSRPSSVTPMVSPKSEQSPNPMTPMTPTSAPMTPSSQTPISMPSPMTPQGMHNPRTPQGGYGPVTPNPPPLKSPMHDPMSLSFSPQPQSFNEDLKSPPTTANLRKIRRPSKHGGNHDTSPKATLMEQSQDIPMEEVKPEPMTPVPPPVVKPPEPPKPVTPPPVKAEPLPKPAEIIKEEPKEEPIPKSDFVARWHELPEKALVKVFSHCVANEGSSIPVMVRMSRVCSAWHKASADTKNWTHLDLSSGRLKSKHHNDKKLEFFLKKYPNVLEVRLNGWKNSVGLSTLKLLAQHCPNVLSLGLSGCFKLTNEDLKFIGDSFPKLERIDLSNVSPSSSSSRSAVSSTCLSDFITHLGPRLTNLNLSNNKMAGLPFVFKALSTHSCNLEELDVSNITTTSRDTILINVEKFQKGCPKLRVLNCNNTMLSLTETPIKEQIHSPGFPKLRELYIAVDSRGYFDGLDDSQIERVLKKSDQLKVLDIRGCQHVTDSCLIRLPTWDVERLVLAGCSAASSSSDGIELIVRKWATNLRDLDVSGTTHERAVNYAVEAFAEADDAKIRRLNLLSTAVNIKSLTRLLKNCPTLEHLNLTGCRGLPRGMKRLYSRREDIVKLRTDVLEGKFNDGDDSDD